MKAYFLISVSNKTNLELCLKYGLAGFTNSINGLWTFVDIQKGDFVSFIYGAKVFNLYHVIEKKAFKDAYDMPPWKPVTFSMSGKTYYFPFRLKLEPVRELQESLVRAEFAYVAENLLLRGGYRRTHFQADQTTLQAVSQMGRLNHRAPQELEGNYKTFVPRLTTDKEKGSPPEVFLFSELILQAIVRQHLAVPENLGGVFNLISLSDLDPTKFESLGEKALPEGHVDILLKEAIPFGLARKIIVEAKLGGARKQYVEQIKRYIGELGEECIGAILIARDFTPDVLRLAQQEGVQTLAYSIGVLDSSKPFTFEEARDAFRLSKAE